MAGYDGEICGADTAQMQLLFVDRDCGALGAFFCLTNALSIAPRDGWSCR